MRSFKDIFTEKDMREIINDKKFFGSVKMDYTKYNLGLETLYYVALLEKTLNERHKHNPKNLMKSFDLVGLFHGSNISTLKMVVELKKGIYGKDYLRKCCLYAIFRSYSNDLDIVLTLRSMMGEKKLESKRRKKLN